MYLKKRNLLQDEAESTTSSSASTPAPATPATPAPEPKVESPAPEVVDPGETTSTTLEDDAGADSPVDWAAMSDTEDDGDGAEPQPAAPAAKPTAPAPTPAAAQPAPAAAPATEPKPGEAPQPPAAATPPKPAETPAKPAETPAAPQPQKTPEQLAAEQKVADEARQKEEERYFTSLTEYYKIPEDMIAKLPTEPENVLPYLAARVHQAVARDTIRILSEMVPQQITAVTNATRAEAESKKAFYDRWPGLAQHEDKVLKAGQLFRQLNPTATPQEAIERIGQTVHAALGIPLPAAPGGSPVAAAPQPAAPAFQPAGGGGGGRGAPPASDNTFENLAEEFLREDAG